MSNARLERLKAKDLQTLIVRGARSFVGSNITEEQIKAIEGAPYSYSIFVDDKICVCGGAVEYWQGRGESWAVIDPEVRHDFVKLHTLTKKFLNECPIRRIEAAVEVDFPAGHRWVKALGFKKEAERLEAFLPNGNAASLYSRVRSA